MGIGAHQRRLGRLYLIHADATGDATQCDGGWASGLGSDSATATEVPLLYQATYLGSVISGGALQAESASGICGIHARYVSVAMWNASVAGVALRIRRTITSSLSPNSLTRSRRHPNGNQQSLCKSGGDHGISGLDCYDRATGATSILWTPQNTATGHGRISAVWDRGSGAHPLRYTSRMRTQWNATAGNGDELRLYIVQADAAADPTQTDGGITFGDADTTNENPLLYNALYLGCIMSNGASHPESTSGLVYLSGRYVGVAAWNGAGSQARSIRPTTTCSPLPNFPMKSRRHHKWVQTKSKSSPARQRFLPPLA